MACDHGHTHLFVLVHACGYYSRAVTDRGGAFILVSNSICDYYMQECYMYMYMYVRHYSYACSWRRLSPCTDGMSGEGKDLWLFFFTDHLPDIIEKLTEGLQGYLYLCIYYWFLYN